MAHDLTQDEQDDIVQQLDIAAQTDGDEFEELYDRYHDQLDVEHQIEVSDNLSEFADNAVGSEHWDSDA